jgi:hypothetical protein
MTDTLPPLDRLHAAIMNLPCVLPGVAEYELRYSTLEWDAGYRYGYRAACHAAAELVSAALPAAQPTVNPPEFQEVSWGVDSVMRPCLGMAVSEYAFRQWAQDVGVVLAAPVAAQPAADGVAPVVVPSQHPDTILLDFIASEYLDVSAFAMPTGAGDADVGWKLVQEHEGKKGRVEVACHYRDDLRAAIREAMQALGYIPPDGVAPSAEPELSERDKALIERGWRRYSAAAPRCDKAPAGWHCTRSIGHKGPCAAEPDGVGSSRGGER